MALRLLHCGFSTCSQKVRLCLAEKELEHEQVEIDLARGEHLEPQYLALNPNGVVPTLLDGGRAVTDSSVICEYLDETRPDPALMPSDPFGRAQVRAWMRYLEEVPTTAIRVPSFNRIFDGVFADSSASEFADFTSRLPLRRDFYRKMGTAGFSTDSVDQSIARLREALERAEQAIGDGWLVGDSFTLADILLVPTVVRMEDLGLARVWSDLPALTDWYGRVRSRPSFAATFYAGSRLDPSFAWSRQSIEAGAQSHA